MSIRGPYRQYEANAAIPVPRQTLHNRRKRCRIQETEQADDEIIHNNLLIHQIPILIQRIINIKKRKQYL